MQMQIPVMTLQNLMQFNDTLFDNIVLPAGADRDLMKYAILFNYNEMQVLYPDWTVFRFTTENWFAAHLSQLQHLFNDWEASYNPVYNKDGYYEEERTPNLSRQRTSANSQTEQQDGTFSGLTVSDSSGTVKTNTKTESDTNGTSEVTTSEKPGSVMTESGSETNQYKGFNSSTFNDVTKTLPGKVTTASGENTGSSNTTNAGDSTDTFTGDSTESNAGSVTESRSTSGNRNTAGSAEETETETGVETIKRHEYGNIGVTMASQMLRDDLSFWERFAFYDVAAKLYAVDNLVMIY